VFGQMAAVSGAAFRARLAELPVRERARFVAELYRARGWTAEVGTGDDAPLVSLIRDGQRRRLLLHVARRLSIPLPLPGSLSRGLSVPSLLGVGVRVPDGVDAVVTPRSGRPRGVPPDVSVIDGGALYERAVHGIDAAARERLFEQFFGRPAIGPDSDRAGGWNGADGPTGGSAPDAGRWRTLHVALGVVALVLVAAAVVGLPADSDVLGVRGAADGDPGDRSGIGTPTPFVGTGGGANGTGTAPDAGGTATPEPPPPDAYPPGVNESGIVDPEALLAAHARQLEFHNYRMVLTYSEYDDVGRIGERELVATVRHPRLARTSLSEQGAGFGVADPVPFTELFADGNAIYYRQETPEGTRYSIERGRMLAAQAAAFGRPYLTGALDVDSSRLVGSTVRGDERLFRISIRGDTDPRTEDVTGLLVVDGDGAVHQFRRQYAPSGSDEIQAEVTLLYEFGVGEVEPPAWLAEARRLLVDQSTAFVGNSGDGENATVDGSDGGPTGSGGAASAIDWLSGDGSSAPAAAPDPVPSS